MGPAIRITSVRAHNVLSTKSIWGRGDTSDWLSRSTVSRFHADLHLGGGGFIVASGTHPVSGEGRRAVFCYDANGKLDRDAFVDDPLLDPLDLALHNGYVYVTSEFPFGKDDATVSLRRYDARNGARAGTWSAENTPAFARVRKPRGIAFADDDTLLMCAQNCVLAVDVTTFGAARVVAEDNDLAGQSLALGAIVTRASRL